MPLKFLKKVIDCLGIPFRHLKGKGSSVLSYFKNFSKTLRRDPKKALRNLGLFIRKLCSFRTIKIVAFKSIKWGAISSLCLAALVAAAITIASYVIEPEDVSSNIKAAVRESTGAELVIDKTDLSLVQGITFSGVKLFPEDLKSKPDQAPLVTFAEVALHYSFWKIFTGQFLLDRAELVKPEIYLKQNAAGISNFQPIIDKLGAGSAPPEQEEPEEEQKDDSQESSGGLLIEVPVLGFKINPANLAVLPFKLRLENIGFKNLHLTMDQETLDEDKKIKLEQTKLEGLSTNISFHWFGADLRALISISNPEGTPLTISIKEKFDDPKLNKTKLEASLLIKQTIGLTDLDRLDVSTDFTLQKLDQGELKLENIPAKIDISLSDFKSLESLRFEKGVIDLADILKVRLSGKVDLIDGSPDNLNLDILNSVSINLDKSNELISQLKIPINVGGLIDLKSLQIQGPLKHKEIVASLPSGTVPNAKLKLKLQNVKASIKEQNLKIHPIFANIMIDSTSSAGENGIQIETESEIKMTGLNLVQQIENKPTPVSVKNLVTNISARYRHPAKELPFARLNLEIDEIKAKMDEGEPIALPLSFETYGSVTKYFNRINLDTKLDINNLLDFSLDLRCKKRCDHYKLNKSTRLEDFAKLYAFVKPVLSKFMPLDSIPEYLRGSLTFQTSLKGRGEKLLSLILPGVLAEPEQAAKDDEPDGSEDQPPKPKKASPPKLRPDQLVMKILQTNKGRLGASVTIENFDTKIPKNDLTIDNFGTKLAINGSFKKQSIELRQGVDRVSMVLPGEPAKNFNLKHFTFDTRFANETDEISSIESMISNLKSTLKSNIYVGQVALEGALPKPLNSLGLELELKQSKLKKIQLTKVSVSAPDFGAKVTVAGNAYLPSNALETSHFIPESFKVSTDINVKHSGGDGLASGIQTAGSMNISSSVETEDMKVFDLKGAINFDKFNLIVANKKDPTKPLVDVNQVNGSIPLRQSINTVNLAHLICPAPLPACEGINANKPPQDPADSSKNKEGGSDSDDLKTNQSVAENKPDQPAIPQIDAIEKYFERSKSNINKNTNLVGHVDYQTVKTFYPEHRSLSIKKVSAANLDFNNLEFDIEVKQNWFSLSQFNIGFLGGKIQGDMKVAFSPLPDAVKLGLHITRLNTQKLIQNFPNLKGKAASWDLFSDPYLDSNVHIDFDIKNNDISGGIDITTIGKEQLKMMLFYLDPEEKNPSLGTIRTALNFGDVSNVTIPIKNGFIGLDVGLTVLAVPIPLPKLDRFPIGELIGNLQTDQQSPGKPKDEQNM